MSSDTTGLITPADDDGNKFIEVMVDECSGCTDVQLMQKNREAGKAIVRSLAKIQRLCDKKARRLHTYQSSVRPVMTDGYTALVSFF